MQKNTQENQLLSHWERSDWRESLFAPGVSILQALTKSGTTASGLGDCRKDALDRCLSETAEILAKASMCVTRTTSLRVDIALAGQSGIAAHWDLKIAKLNALFEAHERVSIWQWWLGRKTARKAPEDWLTKYGFTSWLESQRADAAIKRVTALWILEDPSEICVAICKSENTNGQEPILGFGASICTFDAVKKAMREVLLMEINLIEVLAARSGFSSRDMSRIEAKIASYSARCPAILTDIVADLPTRPNEDICFDKLIEDRNSQTQLHDITPRGQKRVVWECHIPGTSELQPNNSSSPFM